MIRKLLLAAAALCLSAGAHAAPADRASSSKSDDIRMMHDLARCVADRNSIQVRRLLATDYRDSGYPHSMRRLAEDADGCLPFFGSLKMANLLLAGSLAEAMLRNMAAPSLPLARALAHDPAQPAVAARDEGEYLGLCVARTMPAAVEALLATTPESEAEKSAIAAIGPGIAPCVRAGSSARINRPGLRALLALAAYRVFTLSSAGASRRAGS